MESDCKICEEFINTDETYNICDICKGFMHSKCLDLSTTEQRCIPLKKRTLMVVCRKCKNVMSRMSLMLDAFETMKSGMEEIANFMKDVLRKQDVQNSEQIVSYSRAVTGKKRSLKDGGVVLECNGKNSKDMKEEVQKSLGAGYVVSEPKKIIPKLKIVNIPKHIEKDEEDLKEKLIVQNGLNKVDEEFMLNIIHISKENNNKYNMLIEVDMNTYNQLINKGSSCFGALYGGEKGDKLPTLRHKLFVRSATNAKVNLARLPPTEEAVNQHLNSTYHQLKAGRA
ncbi:unnamed protein product [Phaedon cochleariae]|uniref:PHD-type domain-containing protein n=1 Tax=Phaedon cochleariae TaxID=80249 RepID=A0A9N9SGI0_PHACE|nr:unnamed protein product [Phaedon cochleariae]